MRIYLAGGDPRNVITNCCERGYEFITDTSTHSPLPNVTENAFEKCNLITHPNVLLSYANFKNKSVLMEYSNDLIMDSGAYTFLVNQWKGKKNPLEFEEYVEKYGEFIKEHKIQNYFELDIDKIIGYEKVKYFRDKLYKMTGVPPIPVWHFYRGINEFYKHVDEYPYVAYGDFLTSNISNEVRKKVVPHLIAYAHKNGAKIHGLGCTSCSSLEKYRFDSVDSSSWSGGGRFGVMYVFTGNRLRQIPKKSEKRLSKHGSNALDIFNYIEWSKYCEYAEENL